MLLLATAMYDGRILKIPNKKRLTADIEQVYSSVGIEVAVAQTWSHGICGGFERVRAQRWGNFDGVFRIQIAKLKRGGGLQLAC